MDSFNAFPRANKEDRGPHAPPATVNDTDATPMAEDGPDRLLVQANIELRSIVNGLRVIPDPADRVPVFERMFKGPEVVTTNPALIPFFDRVAEIEHTYGREAVKEIAILYGADRIKSPGS